MNKKICCYTLCSQYIHIIIVNKKIPKTTIKYYSWIILENPPIAMILDTPWTLKTASFALIFTIIAIPFWLVCAPIYVIIKTLATVFQPYLYKKQSDEWNEMYQEN